MSKKLGDFSAQYDGLLMRELCLRLRSKRGELIIIRILDVLLSMILLLLLSPIILIVSLLIYIDDPGPIFFRQERVTIYEEKFRIWKFRTMFNVHSNQTITLEEDSRITRVGKKIRKYRIDEIPQLINVLHGEMSFVGPRPEITKYVEQYNNDMMTTLIVKAGITSNAAIDFKDEARLLKKHSGDHDRIYIEEVLPRKMNINIAQLRNIGLIDYLKTMLRTALVIFK